MRKLPFTFFILTVSGLLFTACADKDTDNLNELEEVAFAAWMERNAPTAVKQYNGLYVEMLTDNTNTADLSTVDGAYWAKLNYTGTSLSNEVYVTRYEETAREQGTFTVYTHYTPNYMFFGDTNTGLIEGLYSVMKSNLKISPSGSTTKLRKGSKVKIFMPSSLAFGSSGFSNKQGYGGQYSLPEYKPVIEEIEVMEVVEDPVVYEEGLVDDFATTYFTHTDNTPYAVTDTIISHFFIDSMLLTGGSIPALKDEFLLTVDSTAVMWFVGRFMDGFMFDSNIEDVQETIYRHRSPSDFESSLIKTTTALSYKPSSDESSYISAYYKMIENGAVRRGVWYRMIFTSAYAYGATGKYASSSSSSSSETTVVTEVQPYTPLIFDIYIETGEDDEDIEYPAAGYTGLK